MCVFVNLVGIGILLLGCVKEACGACPNGFWGAECKQMCAAGCYIRSSGDYGCDVGNGVCSRCIDGFYGPHCDSRCADNCQACEQDTGVCSSCEYSWYGDFCNERCPSNCKYCSDTKCHICVNGYWGTHCEKECNLNEECERNCSAGANSSTCENPCKCNSCGKSNGECYTCAYGFWGTYCDKQCPLNCLQYCERNNGYCKCDSYDNYNYYIYGPYQCDSCIDGFWGKKCQYSCPTERCFRCDRYGQCIDCKDGLWGQHCENVCIGCDVCDKKRGYCTKCSDGFWGRKCEKQCTGCITCNMYKGYCESCRPGYWGEKCDRRCPDECDCCDIYWGHCRLPGCPLNIYDREENTAKGSEQTSSDGNMSTTSIVGIAMIAVGFVLCVICVTMLICMFRRLRINKARKRESVTNGSGKERYVKPRSPTDSTNAEDLYDSPVYEDEL